VHVTRSRAALRTAAEACRASGAEVVILCGGDGSYGAGVTALIDAYAPNGAQGEDGARAPVIALSPGGTVGTVPRTLGLAAGGGPIDGLARLLHAAVAGRFGVRETPTLAVRADDAAARLAFIFGSGLVARFFALYDAGSVARAGGAGDGASDGPSGGGGYVAAAKIVARVFVESFYGGAYARSVLDPIRCDVHVDGARLPWDGQSLIVSSVIDDLGLGMRVTHRAGEDPERPHLVVSGLPPQRLGPRLPRVLRGVPIGDPGEPCFDGLVRVARLVFPGEPGAIVLDGDVRLAREVELRAGPTVRLLALTAR
jgi:diacylglycerol kinase family enzyme